MCIPVCHDCLQFNRCYLFRCRRTAGREGEIQDDQRRARRNLLGTCRLLVGPSFGLESHRKLIITRICCRLTVVSLRRQTKKHKDINITVYSSRSLSTHPLHRSIGGIAWPGLARSGIHFSVEQVQYLCLTSRIFETSMLVVAPIRRWLLLQDDNILAPATVCVDLLRLLCGGSYNMMELLYRA